MGVSSLVDTKDKFSVMSFRKAKIISALIAIIFLIIVITVGLICHHTLLSPLPITQSITVKVYPQTGIEALAEQLESRGLIQFPAIFIQTARLTNKAARLRYGEYRVHPGQSAWQLLNQIIMGEDLVKHRIIFIEGWTFERMKTALFQNPNLRHTFARKCNSEIMRELDVPYSHPEGLFFPDTYQFVWGNTDIDILKQAYDNMQIFLNEQWSQRAKKLPYKNVYQALIVASLIEKETAIPKERSMIAAVILRRLQMRMRLQIDPTVLFGLKKSYGSPITKQDLKQKTPYNTYVIYGLPPTPIDMPSGASIIAALHPANIKALYYVSRGDGTHQFSVNYRAHLAAVNRYQEPIRRAEQTQEITIKIPLYIRDSSLTTFGHFILQSIGMAHELP